MHESRVRETQYEYLTEPSERLKGRSDNALSNTGYGNVATIHSQNPTTVYFLEYIRMVMGIVKHEDSLGPLQYIKYRYTYPFSMMTRLLLLLV